MYIVRSQKLVKFVKFVVERIPVGRSQEFVKFVKFVVLKRNLW